MKNDKITEPDYDAVLELESVRKLNLELDSIINNSYDGIWVMDGNGLTLRVNKTYEKFSGIRIQEVLGRNIHDLVSEGYFSDSAAIHVLKEKRPVTIIHEIKTGKKAMVTASPIFDEHGEIWRIVANVRDITELIGLKEKLEAIEAESRRYQEELEQLKRTRLVSEEMISVSSSMKIVLEAANRVAGVDSTVLVLGESGVGKGVLAKLIHQASKRQTGPMITINCAALPESLLESELFGYEKGTFTGALKEGKQGLIELADKGTLFLDEIAELPLHLQTKLLQVIQDQKFYRLGGRKTIDIDVRIIAATNRDLLQMVREGRFREDLYYRLHVVPITIPPLRERKDDILPLSLYFLQKFNQKYGYAKKIPTEVADFLTSYEWPGNVRELENLIERLVVMSGANTIALMELPKAILKDQLRLKALPDSNAQVHPDHYLISVSKQSTFKAALEELEKQLIMNALHEHGSCRRAALHLGMHHSTLARKCKQYEIILA
ncbi:sigma-54 interaction domain-containing protein [Ferviditalea candida]|uniref:HTH-type transcriptional regulatory protein TyrR n=1 Tax=Ferviditalea candida TaxID=3108399 RepID=A0ABU5ZFV3_9BACL|nr:sigma 54-interacting transcriptional regulator [Paenibacillaceae bacterium T2]